MQLRVYFSDLGVNVTQSEQFILAAFIDFVEYQFNGDYSAIIKESTVFVDFNQQIILADFIAI